MRRPIVHLGIILISLTACDSQAPPPAATLAALSTPAILTSLPTAGGLSSPVSATTNAPAVGTAATNATVTAPARGTPTRYATATPTPKGMTTKDDGQSLALSNATYYWTMSIPRDWLTSANNGFEFTANAPDKLASVHLLSQTWLSKERKPTAQTYVDYWKNFKYGNVFPIFADGLLVGQSEISKEKFGGPYLRFEFEDAKKGLHYVQVYASGGGPSSIVATVWAKSADYASRKSVLEAIINSAELLKEQ